VHRLHSGDRLAFYTDGLVDVVSPEGQLFDRHQFKALLLDKASLPLPEFCAAIFTELAIFQGSVDQYDDMTLLIASVE